MSVLDKLTNKKKEETILCGACSHPIIQDDESGKWFHRQRDTKNNCDWFDSKKNATCKCDKANPFPISPSIRLEKDEERDDDGFDSSPKETTQTKKNPNQTPAPENEHQEIVEEPIQPAPRPSAIESESSTTENPIQVILYYLLKDKNYTIAEANLIIDGCKKEIIESIKWGG